MIAKCDHSRMVSPCRAAFDRVCLLFTKTGNPLMCDFRCLAMAGCLLVLSAIPGAVGDLIYQSESGGAISTFDTVGGVPTAIGDTAVQTIDALAFGPGGVLLGIRDTDITNNASLYTIDLNTGAATLVRQTGLVLPEGLAYGLDGTLYTMAGGSLHSLNPATAEAALLASGLVQFDGLTVAPLDVASAAGTIARGSLVGVRPTLEDGGITYIYAIYLDTLTQTLVHTVPLSVVDETLEFGPDGTLYGNDHIRSPGGSGWWVVDLLGDNHQRIGITNTRVWGSAILSVPEPSTLAIRGAGLAAVMSARCRRVREGR